MNTTMISINWCLIDNRKAKNYNSEMMETAYAVLEKNKNADTKFFLKH